MAYAEREDIENIFGADNVTKWADLDNKRNTTNIESRIEWVLDLATTKLDNALRGCPYEIPFSEPYDLEVVEITARMAGLLLYENRISADKNEIALIARHQRIIDKWIWDIRRGVKRLDITGENESVPRYVEES